MTAVVPGAPDYAAMNYDQAFNASETKDRDGALGVLWVDARRHDAMINAQQHYRTAVDTAYRHVMRAGVSPGVDPTEEVERRAMGIIHGEAIDAADDYWWSLEAPDCTCGGRDLLDVHMRGCDRAIAIRERYRLSPL